MADTGGPVRDPGLEAHVARLESGVAPTNSDIAEIRATKAELQAVFDIFAVVGLIGAVLTIAARWAY
jgi:hypothetical protein